MRERAKERTRSDVERKKDEKISTTTPPPLSLSQPTKPPNQPPSQGGIDHLENPLAAAARELREETGIVSARVVAISSSWLVYDSPTRVADPSRPEQPGALVSYRGQTQKWVLMYYYGDSDGGEEVDLGPEDTREFSEWGWRVRIFFSFFFRFFPFVFESVRARAREREEERKKRKTKKKNAHLVLSFLLLLFPQDLAEVAANVVPFKRRAYEAVEREFGPVIAARAAARRRRKEKDAAADDAAADDDDESHRGWWGLSSSSHSHSGHQQRRSSLQNQILPASGVAMKRAQREQQQR